MRKPFVAGNWKMNKTVAEARDLVSTLVPELKGIEAVDRVLCPPFTDLLAVRALLEGTDIGLGAQNMHWEESGAYTGEISPMMLVEVCQYVILGHSERRGYFGETDEGVNKKVKSALAFGLIPIVCVGETLEENEAGQTKEVVTRQIKAGLGNLDLLAGEKGAAQLVIAYEPVWAIGTGKAATSQGANAVVADFIRQPLAEMYGRDFSQAVRVLYGGSVKPDNAAEFFNRSDIDGALVGGASLKAEQFTPIVKAAIL